MTHTHIAEAKVDWRCGKVRCEPSKNEMFVGNEYQICARGALSTLTSPWLLVTMHVVRRLVSARTKWQILVCPCRHRCAMLLFSCTATLLAANRNERWRISCVWFFFRSPKQKEMNKRTCRTHTTQSMLFYFSRLRQRSFSLRSIRHWNSVVFVHRMNEHSFFSEQRVNLRLARNKICVKITKVFHRNRTWCCMHQLCNSRSVH